MSFINPSFMINNRPGLKLYTEIAQKQPIIDYHCHLDAKAIVENKKFKNITRLWLEGDHYKWRAMRANGIAEDKITGNATDEEKFQAWAQTVEACVGNPLYHWTHLELAHYFSVNETLNSRNWREIMLHCNDLLQDDRFRPQALIERSNVEIICTTDSPTDTLEYHHQLQKSAFKTRVLPTFRPDFLFEPQADRFSTFIEQLSMLSGHKIQGLDDLLAALAQRIAYFHQAGCRISDHGPLDIHFTQSDEKQQRQLCEKRLTSNALSESEMQCWNSMIMVALAGMYKQHGWAMQIHFGALRNNNTRQLQTVGINSGFDSIADQNDLARSLNGLLNAMNMRSGLPKTIIYNLNASYNDLVASTLANFQSDENGVKSPMQFGCGWWFNDTKRGMLQQLNTLADQGLLTHFIGMLTDSRSFVSYTRHDYFRRILCNLIGDWVDTGEVPDDPILLHNMIKGICVENARRYFNF